MVLLVKLKIEINLRIVRWELIVNLMMGKILFDYLLRGVMKHQVVVLVLVKMENFIVQIIRKDLLWRQNFLILVINVN